MGLVLLVIGGGVNAAPALRWAREAGLGTVLADPDPHAPSRRAAREFHPVPARDAEAHAALARRLAKAGELAGLLVTEPGDATLLPALATALPELLPPRLVLERMLHPERTRELLGSQGFAIAAPLAEQPQLELFAFFRDGAFVPGGIAARRTLPRGDVVSVQPSGLAPELERAAYALAERAARALGCERGLLQVTLLANEQDLAVVRLFPGFADMLGATHVARLAHGKSPLQAWFAHLAGAGGPFDELALVPRSAAGWLSLAPDRAGLFAGVDGLSRARAVPGVIDLWIEEPGRKLASPEIEQRPLGYVWAEASDHAELAQRLLAARATLELRVAGRQRVA